MDKGKSSQKSEQFWRSRIKTCVVDLRELSRDRRVRHSGDVIKYEISSKPLKKKTLPDDYYATEYENLFARPISIPRDRQPQEESEQPSREELLAELVRIDEEDMRVRTASSQKETINYPSAPPTPRYSMPQIDVSSRIFQKRDTNIPLIRTQKSKRKKFIVVLILMLLLGGVGGISLRVAAVQGDLTMRAERALAYMQEGRSKLEALDAEAANASFTDALNEFSRIENSIGFVSGAAIRVATHIPIPALSSGAHLVEAGKLFALAGKEASYALQSIQNVQDADNILERESSLSVNTVEAIERVKTAQNYIERANTSLARVNPAEVPERFRGDFLSIQSQTIRVEILLQEAVSSLDILATLLGHEHPKNYLLLFQNSSELRPTGGFVGTYGLLELQKGAIENIKIEGVYYPDGQLAVKVIPPRPLQYVTPDWGMRDANWFFDFPTSAKKIIWFYERTGGTTPDGVIAITPAVIEQLLEIVGPIEMPNYNMTLTSENFLESVQQEVEEDYDRALNRPKQILADAAPIILERLAGLEDKMAALNLLLSALEYKDIMLYSRDEAVAGILASRGWDGAVSTASDNPGIYKDYLATVIANIGGWKTDRFTKTEVSTRTEFDETGDIIRIVTLRREHDGGNTQYKWYNKPNIAYIKFYVPQGATLISARGFSAAPQHIETNYEGRNFQKDPQLALSEATYAKDVASGTEKFLEGDKVVFGNWLIVQPQHEKTVEISYKLPRRFSNAIYSLTLQKQAGIEVNLGVSVENAFSCKNNDGMLGNNFTLTLKKDTTIDCAF